MYTASLMAGERAGNLDAGSRRFVAHSKVVDTVRKRTISALVYPAILIGLALVLVSIIVIKVVPTFSDSTPVSRRNSRYRLVAQQALDLLPRAVRQGCECVAVEGGIERIRSESGDALDLERVLDDVDRKPLLRSLLGEVEAAVVVQPNPQRKRRLARLCRSRRQGVTPMQPAGAGEMGDQVQPGHVEVEELAASRDRINGQAGERRDWWVVRLQHADRRDLDARHDVADSLLGKEVGKRLHLRKFRHAAQSASSRGAPIR